MRVGLQNEFGVAMNRRRRTLRTYDIAVFQPDARSISPVECTVHFSCGLIVAKPVPQLPEVKVGIRLEIRPYVLGLTPGGVSLDWPELVADEGIALVVVSDGADLQLYLLAQGDIFRLRRYLGEDAGALV